MLEPNLRHGILLYNSNACKQRCAAQAAPALPAACSPFLNPPLQLKKNDWTEAVLVHREKPLPCSANKS